MSHRAQCQIQAAMPPLQFVTVGSLLVSSALDQTNIDAAGVFRELGVNSTVPLPVLWAFRYISNPSSGTACYEQVRTSASSSDDDR